MLLILTLCLFDAKPRQAPLPPQAPELVVVTGCRCGPDCPMGGNCGTNCACATPAVVTPPVINAQLYQEAITYIDRHQPTIRYTPVYQPYTPPVRYSTVIQRPFVQGFSARSAAACSSGG